MRLYLGLLLVGSVALVACSGDDGGGLRLDNNGPGTAPSTPTTSTGSAPAAAPGPVAPACPTTVAAATSISATDTNATDVHLVPGAVMFRNDLKVIRVDLATGVRTEPYASPDLVHSFSDADVIVTIESPNPPDAVLKVLPAGATSGTMNPNTKTDGGLTTTPPNWSAGGTYVFASDATSFYVLADVTNQGDTIYKVSKADPNQMTQLANLEQSSLGDPQLSGTDVWFTRDQKRVYKVTQTVDAADPTGATVTASDPTEIFGIGYANCNLAVGGSHTYCSTGKALEQRDLTGGDLQTVLDAQKMSSPTLLGAAQFGSDTVFVRSLPSSTTDALKNGIHAIKGTDDKLLVCGREAINAFAADDTKVVWAEQGKGVFSAPR